MIVAAAIRLDGKNYLGIRHVIIIGEMHDLGLRKGGEQGFVDDKGTFLDRHKAGEHAIACGQIAEMRWPGMGLDSMEVFPR